jgi:hypothetical protein
VEARKRSDTIWFASRFGLYLRDGGCISCCVWMFRNPRECSASASFSLARQLLAASEAAMEQA